MRMSHSKADAPEHSLDELITLKKAADSLGLSKKTLSDWTKAEDDPLPCTVGDNGYRYVTLQDVQAYLARHPVRRKPANYVDRAPLGGGEPGKTYITIAEAAEASGYTQSGIRNMIRSPINPLKASRNADGWYLIDADEFWNYLECRGLEQGAEPMTADFTLYPELGALDGTFQTPAKISAALGIPIAIITEWQTDPHNPLPYISNGKRSFINKYRVPSYIESRELGRERLRQRGGSGR